ncbi:MAG TPA: radical SAM protein [candidate division Zixibacteria bacterium]|nr:radical SAM protein [candidate division Zixibacteria bacterium]HBZ00628.1 radical SAM protein [candidate division Zixibacteria bacterium]
MADFSKEAKIARLERRVPEALAMLDDCIICPRECHVNRTTGSTKGICGVDSRLKISSANLHYGEEPPISGSRGSGTIFLSGCNLKCVYCQNYPISQLRNGEIVTFDELSQMMLDLERRGVHNINLVTPTHYVPQLMAAMLITYKSGLSIPIVYNTSGYDSVDILRLLDGIVEIYMPDMRYAKPEMARCYSAAKDYPEMNRAAIKEMYHQVGDLQIDDDGIAIQGLLVRHLVLPENIAGSEEIFRFIAEEISVETHVSLMSQYFPAHKAISMDKVNRRILKQEYQEALEAFERAGLGNGFIQPYGGKD